MFHDPKHHSRLRMLGIGFGHTTARWLSERNLLLEPGAAIAPPAAAMPSARCVRHPDGVPWLPTGSIGLTGHGCQVRTPSLFSLWDKFRFPTRAHSSALRCPWSRLVARGIEQYPPLPTPTHPGGHAGSPRRRLRSPVMKTQDTSPEVVYVVGTVIRASPAKKVSPSVVLWIAPRVFP